MRTLLLIAALLFLGHACKGVCDTLQFHYDDSRYSRYDNDRFWNPQASWENKWQHGEDGKLIRPLTEKFPGSSTVFVATTDAWHLFQALQYAFIRLAIVLSLLLPLIELDGYKWWYAPALYAALWLIQAAGFHLTYTIL